MQKETVDLILRIKPISLHKKLVSVARKEDISLNKMIILLLKKALDL